MSKGLKIAAPIALGATGLGLAGMGPLAGLLGAGKAAGAGAAAEGVGSLLGGAEMVANPMSPGNLIAKDYLAENFLGNTFVGDGNILSKAGNFAQNIMPGEWDWLEGPGGQFDMAKFGMNMMQGGEQQQMPQNVVNQSAPRQPMQPTGSFMESADAINAKREEWLRKLGRGA